MTKATTTDLCRLGRIPPWTAASLGDGMSIA